MDPERARELLAAERARIERSLARLAHQDDAEEHDDEDPANLATDLYDDELGEGLADDLRDQLEAVERAFHDLTAQAVPLGIDFRVDERERPGKPPVADLARPLVAVVQLVAELRRVVDHAERRG